MLRIGVIGAGHWGPNLIRNFHEGASTEVACVADTAESRQTLIRERFPTVQVTGDALEIIDGDAVDAVVITTPTSTHYELAKRALECGKHVLVEKPICTRSDEAEELCELAERNQRVLVVGHVFLFNQGVRHVKDCIDAGRLGDLYYVSMVRTNLGPIRVDVNASWDLAAHDISIANYWFDAEPVEVSAAGGAWVNQGIDDAVFATLRYPSGALANLHVSWLSPRKARDITVVGARSMLTFDDMNLTEPIRIYDKHVDDVRTAAPYIDSFASFRSTVRDGDILIPKVSLGEPLRAECSHFVDCIENGTTPLADGRCGLAVVKALEAIDRSLAAGGRRETV